MHNILSLDQSKRKTPIQPLTDAEEYAQIITFLSEDDDVQAVYDVLRNAGYERN